MRITSFYLKTIILLLLLFLLFQAAGCSAVKFDSSEKLEELFYANEEAFRNAAATLDELAQNYDSGISIYRVNIYENTTNERIFVRKIHDLYFISLDQVYTDEDYEKVYDVVTNLFSSLNIAGVAGGKTQIQFCIESAYGIESSIFYRTDGLQPSICYPTIEEKCEFEKNWFAVVYCD